MQDTQVWSLGQEDPLEKEMATYYSSILAWRIPWTEEPGGLQSMELQRVRHDWMTFMALWPVNLKGNQPWMLIGRIDAEAEAPVLWPPDVKS